MAEKMITLYKYLSREHIEEILTSQRLMLSNGENFNDPFDVTVTDRKSGSCNKIKGLHILCLTNSHQAKLMWSHYGDAHKGFCLTVKIPKKWVYPICYSSERVFENSNLDQIINNSKKIAKKNVNLDYTQLSQRKKEALVKDKKWMYEKEYRVIFDQDDEKSMKSDSKYLVSENGKWYLKVKIRNIYLGVNVDDIQLEARIRELCETANIEVTRMELSSDHYSINAARRRT